MLPSTQTFCWKLILAAYQGHFYLFLRKDPKGALGFIQNIIRVKVRANQIQQETRGSRTLARRLISAK